LGEDVSWWMYGQRWAVKGVETVMVGGTRSYLAIVLELAPWLMGDMFRGFIIEMDRPHRVTGLLAGTQSVSSISPRMYSQIRLPLSHKVKPFAALLPDCNFTQYRVPRDATTCAASRDESRNERNVPFQTERLKSAGLGLISIVSAMRRCQTTK
jgi:hypothetical protein